MLIHFRAVVVKKKKTCTFGHVVGNLVFLMMEIQDWLCLFLKSDGFDRMEGFVFSGKQCVQAFFRNIQRVGKNFCGLYK